MRLMSACFCLPLLIGTHAMAKDKRSLDAHEHGHSRLTIAIEAGQLAIELEAPGADIVGFEHAAATDADKALIEDAKDRLKDPVDLFGIPASAACVVSEVTVELLGDNAHDEHEHDHASDGGGHTEFLARYLLDCEDLSGGTVWASRFFETFGNAVGIGVNMVGDQGQAGAELTREQLEIDLSPVL